MQTTPLTAAQRQQYRNARAAQPVCNPARTVLNQLRHFPAAWARPVGPSAAEILVARATQAYAYENAGKAPQPHLAKAKWQHYYRHARAATSARTAPYDPMED